MDEFTKSVILGLMDDLNDLTQAVLELNSKVVALQIQVLALENSKETK